MQKLFTNKKNTDFNLYEYQIVRPFDVWEGPGNFVVLSFLLVKYFISELDNNTPGKIFLS